ncbi:MAG: hypothetical protein ISQ14_09705, partial [Verrucomicrobiae bacterium]|nr:hypothetical protein [Verrucomicrobiae bacterium]
MKIPRFARGFALLIILLSIAPQLHAATRTWVNPSGGLWSTPANWSGGVVPDSDDTALINLSGTYTVTVDAGAGVAALTVGGAAGKQSLRWTGGILSGPITIAASGEFRFAITGFNSHYSNGTLSNGGTVVFESAATQPWSLSGASIANLSGALVDIQGDASFTRHSGSPEFQNHGTLRKSGGTGYARFNEGVAFFNRGSVQIQSGGIEFNDGLTSSSAFEIDANTQLNLHSGVFHLEPGNSFNGSGDYGVLGGGGPIIDGPLINNNFQIANGEITITNELRGVLHWRSGSIGGELTIAPGGVLNYGITGFNSFQRAGVITNHGSIVWESTATM